MTSAITRDLPTVVNPEVHSGYASELDKKLIETFQIVMHRLDKEYSDRTIFHARVFVRLSLNEILPSPIEEFSDRECLERTLVTIAIQASHKGFFHKASPDEVSIYKNANSNASYPLFFVVDTSLERFSLYCIADPTKEGSFKIGKDEIMVKPNPNVFRRIIEVRSSTDEVNNC